jgi:hypothetical protein
MRAHSIERPWGMGWPSTSSHGRASASRTSSRLWIEPLLSWPHSRAGHSSGGGTSGGLTQVPRTSMSRCPSAAFTVRISASATCPTARAWVTLWPALATVTSMSSIDGGWV